MSGFFGACEFATSLTEDARHALLERMGRQVSATRVAGVRPIVVNGYGAGVALGRCERRNGSAGPASPIVRHDHLWLAFAGRLDHREELNRALAVDAATPAVENGADTTLPTDAAVVRSQPIGGLDSTASSNFRATGPLRCGMPAIGDCCWRVMPPASVRCIGGQEVA